MSHDERKRVVQAAHTWLGTPYHTMGQIKGVGVDCLTLVAEVFTEAGVIQRPVIPRYPHDWHLHQSAERYMNGVLQYAHEITPPALPGDIVLWRFGRCFSHGAIVVNWPIVIHAYLGRCVMLENAEAAKWLAFERGKERPKKFFSHWK